MTNGYNGGDLISEIIPSVAAEYGWPDRRQEVRTMTVLDPKQLAPLAGTYRVAGKPPMVVSVTAENGRLFLASKGMIDKTELLAESDSTFFARPGLFGVVFNRDGAARVASMTIAGEYKGVKAR